MSASGMAPDSSSKADEAKNLLIGLGGLALVGYIAFSTSVDTSSAGATRSRSPAYDGHDCGLCGN